MDLFRVIPMNNPRLHEKCIVGAIASAASRVKILPFTPRAIAVRYSTGTKNVIGSHQPIITLSNVAAIATGGMNCRKRIDEECRRNTRALNRP